MIYKSQRNAWMNSEIFAEWFSKEFVPAVKRHQRLQNIRSPKALLLIDNCSAHPDELSSRDGSVTCMFLPPNTTSLIQPMDQEVLQATKNRYKRKLLQKIICAQDLDQTQSIKDVVKLHTVKDALYGNRSFRLQVVSPTGRFAYTVVDSSTQVKSISLHKKSRNFISHQWLEHLCM